MWRVTWVKKKRFSVGVVSEFGVSDCAATNLDDVQSSHEIEAVALESAVSVCGELVKAVWEAGLLACDMEDDIRFLPYKCQCRSCEVMLLFGRALRECLDSVPLRGCRDVYVGELIDDVRFRLCEFLGILPRDHFQPFARRLAEHIAGTFPAILNVMGRLESQSEAQDCYKQYLAVLSGCWRALSSDDVVRLFPV